VLVLFVGIGIWWSRDMVPLDLQFSVAVPPSFSVGEEAHGRDAVRRIQCVVYDETRLEVARVQSETPQGLEGPLGPVAALRLTRGTYRVQAQLFFEGGGTWERWVVMDVDDAGPMRVELP